MQKIFKEYLASDEREVRFAFVKFNSCNGKEGRSFSKAECEFDVLKENENKPLWVTLEMMFKNGEDFIKTIRNGEETTDPLKTGALGRIQKYYQSKGKKKIFHSIVVLYLNREKVNTTSKITKQYQFLDVTF